MDNLTEIDQTFKKFMANLDEYLPEGLLQVDINLLKELELLNFYKDKDLSFTRYFQVVETDEKISLINEQFIVWIVSEKIEDVSATYVFIALNRPEPHLEIAFSVSGVYNTSRLVLKLLEKYLEEIDEVEESISHIRN